MTTTYYLLMDVTGLTREGEAGMIALAEARHQQFVPGAKLSITSNNGGAPNATRSLIKIVGADEEWRSQQPQDLQDRVLAVWTKAEHQAAITGGVIDFYSPEWQGEPSPLG